MKLVDKVAIVTGGSRGIGKAIVKGFVEEGARVVIVSRNAEKGQETADEINNIYKEKNRVLYIKTDISRRNEVVSMVEETIEAYGKIDILVNNAAILLKSCLVDLKESDWDRVINANLKGCFLCSQAVSKKMIKRNKGGKIINISSIEAQISAPEYSSYAASKGGIEAFSRSLASELSPYKINVNVIEPGAVETGIQNLNENEDFRNDLFKRVPWKEIAKPEMISPTAVFLASKDSYYITGQVIVVDGGYLMNGSLTGDSKFWSG